MNDGYLYFLTVLRFLRPPPLFPVAVTAADEEDEDEDEEDDEVTALVNSLSPVATS